MDETRVELKPAATIYVSFVEGRYGTLIQKWAHQPFDGATAYHTRPADPGEDKVEALMVSVKESLEDVFYDTLNCGFDAEILARAAIAAMGHTPPSGEDGELRELLIESFDFLRGVDDAADLRKRVLTALQGIGGRDAEEAAHSRS